MTVVHVQVVRPGCRSVEDRICEVVCGRDLSRPRDIPGGEDGTRPGGPQLQFERAVNAPHVDVVVALLQRNWNAEEPTVFGVADEAVSVNEEGFSEIGR